MRLSTGIRLLPLLLVLTASACGGDDNDPIGLGDCAPFGTFSGSITGAVTASLSGCAYFGVDPAQGSDPAFFVLALTSGDVDEPTHFILIGREGTRPGVGAHVVGEDPGEVEALITVGATNERLFAATSGTLTITQSSTSAVNGSLNMSFTEVGETATITVTGNFSATCEVVGAC